MSLKCSYKSKSTSHLYEFAEDLTSMNTETSSQESASKSSSGTNSRLSSSLASSDTTKSRKYRSSDAWIDMN